MFLGGWGAVIQGQLFVMQGCQMLTCVILL